MASRIRVLCVDDEPDLAELVAHFLTDHADDIATEIATGGEEALSLLSSERVDCIICDYQMPEMDGIELLEAVRERDPSLPFILFTGRGSEDVASEAVRAGVSDYIPKSTGTDQYELLANRVRNVVERQQARTTTRELFNAASDGIIVHDPESGEIVDVNDAVCELWGVERDALVGRMPASLCVNPDLDPRAWLPDDPEERGPSDWHCQTTNGSTFWGEIRIKPARIDGENRLLAISRDVTERKRREQRLSDLLAAAEELMTTRELEPIGDIVTGTMTTILDFDGAEIYVAEQDEATLRRVGGAGEMGADVDQVEVEAHASDVLSNGGGPLIRDGGIRVDVSDPAKAGSLLYWPMAEHGVLVGNPGTERMSEFTRDLIELLVAISQAAVVRTFHEQRLARQHGELQSLNHMNEVIRDINQTLVKVSTRDEIEQLVCKQLAAASPFVCAWIGDHDLTAEEVRVRVAVGRGADTAREETIPTGSEATDPLSDRFARVIEDREVDIVDELTPSVVGEERAARAEEHGYRSLTILPITYQNALYDLLAIYAEKRQPFGPDQRSVLRELGETIGYAMHTAERSRALLSDTTVELEYHVRDDDDILFGLSDRLDTGVELERIFFRADDSARLFVTVEEANLAAIRDALDEIHDGSIDVQQISTRDGETVVEISVSAVPMMKHLAEAMATIRSATSEDGEGRLVIEIPNTVSVRTLTENLGVVFDDVSLLARRQRDADEKGISDVNEAADMGLTDRQHEVLLTAYHAGFFSWPRESTGEEIADLLDISQPTFHEHLRTGERKLLELIFEHRRSVYT